MDAIDQLVSLFDSQEEFVKAFVESTLFFPGDAIEKRNEELKQIYKEEGKFHVRYSPSFKDQWGINNKKEAKKLTRNNDVSLEGYPSFNIRVDNDGNTKIRKLIKSNFGQEVSVGKKSTIKNYTISHVWGLANHPLFFSSLWNVVLIPTHFNYLMDKNDDIHPMVKKVKNTIKQKCIELYNPYDSFISHFPEAKDLEREFKITSNGTESEYNLTFVPPKEIEKEEVTISKEEQERIEDLLGSMGKKFFVDYFKDYKEGRDLKGVVPVGLYTYNSFHTKVSSLRKIFEEELEIKALTLIIEKENTRLDEETITTAKELREEYL